MEGEDNASAVHTTDRSDSPRVNQAAKVALATGHHDVPNIPGIPGEKLDKVLHYCNDPQPYYNHDVAVIGGKNSAAIAAPELY